jgi:RNA polymerase sigma-70 factor (ECF subfamily)
MAWRSDTLIGSPGGEHPLGLQSLHLGKVRLKEPLEQLMPGSSQAEQWPVEDVAKEDVAKVKVEPPTPLEFRAIYERWFDEVSRWIRAMGGPEADREDLVQDVFLVVHRRLADFDGQNVAGWLYQIARHRVRDFRRLLWVKHMLFGSVPLSESLTKGGASPAESLETKEKRATLERLLSKLNESERAALVLFEIDGYSGEEIAEVQGVPINTVWARIHKARKKLKASLAKIESREQKRA